MATDEQIAEAFNAGYTLQKIDPALVKKLLSTKNENEIMQAMAQGAKKLEQEKVYTAGFNQGYYLSKFEPQTLDKILASENSLSDYFKGMTDGKKEYLREQLHEQFAKKDQSKDRELDR